jgi:hypothetical protein
MQPELYYNCADLVVGPGGDTPAYTQPDSSKQSDSHKQPDTYKQSDSSQQSGSSKQPSDPAAMPISQPSSQKNMYIPTYNTPNSQNSAGCENAIDSSHHTEACNHHNAGHLRCCSKSASLSICDAKIEAWVVLGTVGGACQSGEIVCVGHHHYAMCAANGQWKCMECEEGTECGTTDMGDVVCGAVKTLGMRNKRHDDEL